MKREELLYRHPYHKKLDATWEDYLKIKQSGDDLVRHAIVKHPRESDENFESRLRDAIVFNFGKTVIDIFSFYMNEKETVYHLPGLEGDSQWKMFQRDADLQGTDYPVLMNEAQKYAAYFGAVGVLVNKPYFQGRTLAQEIDQGVYPYYTMYSLPNILDWKWQRDPWTHRKSLSYLKLYEGEDLWTIWRPGSWQQWTLDPATNIPALVAEGENPLKEIPFVWMLNIRNMEYPEVGQSDIVDITRIVFSIAQNLSSSDEIVKYAGFPIMRVPMKRQDLLPPEVDDDVETGVVAISEFDPSLGPNAKSDWMPTQIKEPIEAIIMLIEKKIDEIYRIAYLSGIHSQRRGSNESTSGLALRYEFSQLNSVLVAKSINKCEAELGLLRLWLKWKSMEDKFHDMDIKQSREFSIDELAVTLDNAIMSYKAVLSKTFRERIQRKIAFAVMPDLNQTDKTQILAEIEENTPAACTFDTQVTNRALVKSAADAANQADDQGRKAAGGKPVDQKQADQNSNN